MQGLYEQYAALVEKKDNPSLCWSDIADIRYECTGIRENPETIRKGAKLFYEYLNAGWIHPPTNTPTIDRQCNTKPEQNAVEPALVDYDGSDVLPSVKSQLIQLEKEKIKIRDERNELKRLIREAARQESFTEQVVRSLAEFNSPLLSFD